MRLASLVSRPVREVQLNSYGLFFEFLETMKRFAKHRLAILEHASTETKAKCDQALAVGAGSTHPCGSLALAGQNTGIFLTPLQGGAARPLWPAVKPPRMTLLNASPRVVRSFRAGLQDRAA